MSEFLKSADSKHARDNRFGADRLRPSHKKPFRPSKPKAWSHHDDLKANIGKTVVLHMDGGKRVEGNLIECDAYTIKLRPLAGLDKSVLTYYKHCVNAHSFKD